MRPGYTTEPSATIWNPTFARPVPVLIERSDVANRTLPAAPLNATPPGALDYGAVLAGTSARREESAYPGGVPSETGSPQRTPNRGPVVPPRARDHPAAGVASRRTESPESGAAKPSCPSLEPSQLGWAGAHIPPPTHQVERRSKRSFRSFVQHVARFVIAIGAFGREASPEPSPVLASRGRQVAPPDRCARRPAGCSQARRTPGRRAPAARQNGDTRAG